MELRQNTLIGFRLAPATLTDTSLVLVWHRPVSQNIVDKYQMLQNDQVIEILPASHTYCTVTGLSPSLEYNFSLVVSFVNSDEIVREEITVQTKHAKRKMINIAQPAYHVDTSGDQLSTRQVQTAIDDCPKDGIVWVPEWATIKIGAIDLKSDMTLQVDGILVGSEDPKDYQFDLDNSSEYTKYQGKINEDGLILTRYEGWEMYCYRSMINIGYLNPLSRESRVCRNVTILGKGKIVGAGNVVGEKMKAAYANASRYPKYVSDNIPGRRVRGRLVNVIQATNIHFSGVTFEKSPSWTIHLVYSDTITIHGINIDSQGIDNGDGIDPDSCQNVLMFDINFDTGDDCIAIKSGKNPEGNRINIPSKNIEIFDLNMLGGHGLAIGSEQSGGIEDIEVHDCLIQNTDHGIELKANRERGGYIRHVHISHCKIDSFFAREVQYNMDGLSASNPPIIKDLSLLDCEITGARRSTDVMGHPIDSKNKAIEIIGFRGDSDDYYIEQVSLKNVVVKRSIDQIYLNCCKRVLFQNVSVPNKSINLRLGHEIEDLKFT
ncbi:glycosyl hydrolase family 28 protein [Levilactobacillus tujiorum]|uniref:Glycoside hydrolase family 28 protein n=1 Tax=Levilactobacillus tujiorum TaxID=2912243 RepID=A0ABX1L376_9LACO|nr:glycosyl hydrolase family 28 protein [Levilactobacillus tujiorum]MCH5463826.1 glycosyl hydrolase family 28 protein [Levilactobacillus tujiorum]NLR11033.1 glycoside hydrolase family 28 protein [Lactobacillus sp. HBUAS51387]NLR28769.1 glycoside hydrolase family 28 protein [Levilactobacillus tujiorum]